MCEYSRKGMRVLTQVDESTYVIHRLYGNNRHSKLKIITHNSKLITEKHSRMCEPMLQYVCANASVCVSRYIRMCLR